jgi:integrase
MSTASPQFDRMALAESAVERRLLMRRRYQKGTLIQRGKRELLWVGRWLEDEIRTDGTVHRRHKSAPLGSVNELTKRQAQRELDKLLAPINAGLRTTRHVITFAEFAERWKQDILIHHKASGQTSERAHISKWLVPAFGHIPIADIDIQTIQRSVTVRATKTAPKTTRNILATMRIIWKTARAWGYVTHNPFEGLMLPRRGLTRKTTLTSEQARAVIRLAKEPYRSLFWIIAETGIRGGEVCGLFTEDVDLARQFIHVKRSAWRAQLQTPKTGNAVRSFPISPALSEHLAVFIGERKGLLFSTRTGHPLDNYNVSSWALKPLLTEVGITDTKHMGLHAFRHCNASALDSLGAPMRIRMDRLGHAQQETTMGYSHSNIGDHRRIAAELGRVFCPD